MHEPPHVVQSWLFASICGRSFYELLQIRQAARIRKYGIRVTLTLFVLSAVIVGLGFLPGSVVGVYSGPQCMCDCSNYTVLRDGKIVMYSTGHTPASLLGRYEISRDGVANIYMPPLMADDIEELSYRLRPRLLFSVLEDPDDGSSEWMWKRPASSKVERMIQEQEIKVVSIPNGKEIHTTFYDHTFQKLRVEIRPTKKLKEAEQAGTGQPATRPVFESEGSDQPQPESKGHSR